jgi:polysaccharide chain length determinant protein (PEP-CTERM system associated)
MNEQTDFNVDAYIDLIYRQRKSISCAFAIGLTLTLIAVVLLPRRYESSALIAASPAQVASQISTRTAIDFETRIKTLKHKVLSGLSLSRIIQVYGLYSREIRVGVSRDDLANDMRKRISVNVTADDDWNKSRGGTVMITFEHSDPLMVQRVTQRLADMFIQQDWIAENDQARVAAKFFDDQLARSKIELDAKTDEIELFKSKYQGSLPDDLEVNLRTQASMQAELEHSNESRNLLEDRQMQLGRALAGSIQQSVTIRSPTGQSTWSSPQAALAALETQLTVLRATYSEVYPDVVQLNAEIDALKKRFGDMNRAAGPSLAATPLDAELTKQQDAVVAETTRLNARVKQVQEKIHNYQTRIEETPIHEQQLSVLTRDYSVLTAQYQDLLQKKLGSQMYRSLVARHEGECLQVIEPATLPKGPGSPRTVAILAAGLVLSVVAALTVGFGLSVLNSSIKSVEDLRKCNLQIAATIPTISEIEGFHDKLLNTARALSVSFGWLFVGVGILWLYSKVAS